MANWDEFLMPATFNEFKGSAFERDRKGEPQPRFINEVLQESDALGECQLCGTAITDCDVFADEVATYYKLTADEQSTFAVDLFHSGFVTVGDGSWCEYHNQELEKF